eukprot:6150293-Pyramimonas_sp.AAC.1
MRAPRGGRRWVGDVRRQARIWHRIRCRRRNRRAVAVLARLDSSGEAVPRVARQRRASFSTLTRFLLNAFIYLAAMGGRGKRAKKMKATAADESDTASASAPPPKAAKSAPLVVGSPAPRQSRRGAGSKVQICLRCKQSDKAVEFALDQDLVQAQAGQCVLCHGLWLPLVMIMTWQEFCQKYEDDEDFKRRVKAAAKNPNKIQIYYTGFFKKDVAKVHKYGIEVSRQGSLLTEKDVKDELKQTPKQANLNGPIELDLPTGDSHEGYLFLNGRSKYLDVKVFAITSVDSSEFTSDKTNQVLDIAPEA